MSVLPRKARSLVSAMLHCRNVAIGLLTSAKVAAGDDQKRAQRVEETELQTLAERLAGMILRGMGTRSRWALRTSLDAAETEGVAGICVLRIPPKERDRIDVTFTVGNVDVVSRWGDTA